MLLAGDIGGTKTTLAIFSPKTGPRYSLVEKRYRSAEYPDLESLIADFLSESDYEVEQVCFGVAGPVLEDKATITNLPWVITANRLRKAFKFTQIHLINDLVAVASAIPWLETHERQTVIPGSPRRGGALAVIAPGTGLGEAYLIWDGMRYLPFASEGGHSDFSPSNLMETHLLKYLWESFEHVSCERVCSGIGIPNIYNFLKDEKYATEPAWMSHRLDLTQDPTPIIIKAALDEDIICELCRLTLKTFVSILGAEAGNLALKTMSTGGVYLGGGIPPRILTSLESNFFLEAFRKKGRLSTVLEEIPVHVILNRDIAILGSAYYGLERWSG